MKRNTIVFWLILALGTLFLASCGTAPTTSVATPTVEATRTPFQPETPTPTPEEPQYFYTVPNDCILETRTTQPSNTVEYKSSCGGGTYIVLSNVLFRGGPDDPGVFYNTLAARHATAWWQEIPGEVIFYADQEQARAFVCEKINEQYLIMDGSAWVLGGVRCDE